MSHWQQDAPSRCVLHTFATCLSYSQQSGTAHLIVAGERHAARTPFLQPTRSPASCSAGKFLLYCTLYHALEHLISNASATEPCSQGHLLRGGLLHPCLALTKRRALLPVSRAPRLVRLAQCHIKYDLSCRLSTEDCTTRTGGAQRVSLQDRGL